MGGVSRKFSVKFFFLSVNLQKISRKFTEAKGGVGGGRSRKFSVKFFFSRKFTENSP